MDQKFNNNTLAPVPGDSGARPSYLITPGNFTDTQHADRPRSLIEESISRMSSCKAAAAVHHVLLCFVEGTYSPSWNEV